MVRKTAKAVEEAADPVPVDPPETEETEERDTKVIPIPPDEVRDNEEGELAENGEVIRSTTQVVDAETEQPVEDPNVLRNTAENADENAEVLEPADPPEDALSPRRGRVETQDPGDGFGPIGSPERARAVREGRAQRPVDEDSAHLAHTRLRPEDARGGETTEQLITKANTPIENSGIASKIGAHPSRERNLQVGEQVDLATANLMTQRQTKELNEPNRTGLSLDEIRMIRRRGRTVV